VRVGVDVGGTFTDLVALGADGTIAVRKVTTTPEDPALGLFRAVDSFMDLGARGSGLGTALSSPESRVPSPDSGVPIEVLVHGTTIATNALLERRGARVVLVTTRGFEDLLWLRRQDRALLYDLAQDHPPPLVAREDVVGVAERMGPAGVLDPLADREVERVVAAVRALAPEAVAVAFLFAFRHPEHERRVTAALRDALPDLPVAASHEVLPAFREYERISTATVEAYVRPSVSAYLVRLEAPLVERRIGALRIMTSSGGSLAPAAAAHHAASLALSGPAGGVVGARLVGAAVGVSDLLAIDMGGTSADASLVTSAVALTEVPGSIAGVPLALPAILVETVSAGGGSIARVDEGGALKVGPESAGAAPGPACYGRGGVRPTVTDACLVLGWLDAASPLADELRLDPPAAERAVASLGPAVGREPRAVAAGIVAVAAATMARALKRVSVARGFDPRRLALLPYGGAGPLFGCALADALGMRTIVVPPHPGVLSALGLAAAAERIEVMAPFHRPLPSLTPRELAAAFAPLVARARDELPGAALARAADCRFAGQGYEVTIPAPADDPAPLAVAFLAAHRARYGHGGGGQPIELVNLRVAAVKGGDGPLPQFDGRGTRERGGARVPLGRRTVTVRGARVEASVWRLGELAAGVEIDGPAILAGADATALVEPGWRGGVHRSGAVLLERR
jgi:N-methylhydantoinase A